MPETEFKAEKAKWQSKFEKRKVRITQAHLVVTKQVREGVGGREGRRKQKISEGSTQAERDREAGLANAASTLADFKAKLTESREAFDLLEKETRQCLSRLRQISPAAFAQPAMAGTGPNPGGVSIIGGTSSPGRGYPP